MSLSRTRVMFCIASFCALALIVVASPATFASTQHQAIAQDSCTPLGYMSTDANSHGMVSILQYRLIAKGESLGQYGTSLNGVDGIFGPVTQAAVIAFQKHQWPNDSSQWDGLVGPQTWGALGGCSNPVNCPSGESAIVMNGNWVCKQL